MPSATTMNGKCLCGAVSVKVSVEKAAFDACHCGMCRKWGGGPALCVDASKGLTFSGEEHIATFDSSAWAQRGFCRRCGTHLFYRLKNGGFSNVPLGLLDDVDNLKFGIQIFIDRKPSGYEFANRTETMTEAQVFAKFAPPKA